MIFKNILVTGCLGQVGYELFQRLLPLSEKVIGTDRTLDPSVPNMVPMDLTDRHSLISLIHDLKPQVIFNPAAYTAVDRAEAEPELAEQINHRAPALLASEAEKIGALIVHYSTDYVFDGSGSKRWSESDRTSPLNIYGKTKAAGETAVQLATASHLIFRTSWVFSSRGANFLKTMLKLGSERENLRIVKDQIGAPTTADFLAEASILAAKSALFNKDQFGLFHLCSKGETTWYDFAVKIFSEARELSYPLVVKTVEPILSEEFPVPAKRPLNSRLSCVKFDNTFGIDRPDWQDALHLTISKLLS